MSWFFSPTLHYVATLVHITSAMFWLGWMLFFSIIMTPVLRAEVPDKYYRLRAILQYRTRKLTQLMILLIVLTGVYNLAYRGLMSTTALFYTEEGLWFVLKVSLATLLIGLYFLAPDFSQMSSEQQKTMDEERAQAIATYVHGATLMLGLTVAYLGVSLS